MTSSKEPIEYSTQGGTGLLGDIRLVLYLFIGLRLVLIMVYQPQLFSVYEKNDGDGTYQPIVIERGMSTGGDYRYYHQFIELIDDGRLPYRDFWYEFPPIWIGLYVGVHKVLLMRGSVDYGVWAALLGLIMTLFDTGNLLLLRRIGSRMYGPHKTVPLVWVYAILGAPLVFPWWTFEPMVVFFVLMAVVWLLEGRYQQSAIIIALGTLTKYVPVLILPAVWRFYDRRTALKYSLISLLLVAIVLGPIVAWGGRMAVASLLAQANKASYESVWALLDGNMRTGSFPGPLTRLDAESAFHPYGNDPVIPAWLRLIPFAGIGLYVLTRQLRQDDRGVVAFFTLTVVLFFLWTQGWSPQWILVITPLILLNFPHREGVLLCLVLGLLVFAEYPLLFMRTAETGGEISGALVAPYTAIILVRTVLIVGLALALYRRLTQGVASGPAAD